MRSMIALLLTLLVLSPAARSQNPTSQLNGTVIDPQGAAVVGAAVEVINTATNARFSTSTNERGEWVIPALPTSIYRVTVTAQGFRTASVHNVKLDAGVPATVNVKLELGTVNDTIEVISGADDVPQSGAGQTAFALGHPAGIQDELDLRAAHRSQPPLGG